MPAERYDVTEITSLLRSGTRRLVRTVDALPDEEWSRPSLLPGWRRAHVVAHLTLNAVALHEVLGGVLEGRTVAMYPSQEERDAAVDELAGAGLPALREQFLASTTLVGDRVEQLPAELATRTVERVPGGRTFLAGDIGVMRLLEVEVHHADLGLDHTAADWPAEVVDLVLTRRAGAYAGPAFTAHATDLGRRWAFGSGELGATVSGAGSALAWWAAGRGSGEGLTSDDGRVPGIEAW